MGFSRKMGIFFMGNNKNVTVDFLKNHECLSNKHDPKERYALGRFLPDSNPGSRGDEEKHRRLGYWRPQDKMQSNSHNNHMPAFITACHCFSGTTAAFDRCPGPSMPSRTTTCLSGTTEIFLPLPHYSRSGLKYKLIIHETLPQYLPSSVIATSHKSAPIR